MKLPVFYQAQQSVSGVESFSPSAGKPQKLLSYWANNADLAETISINGFEPLTFDDLALAHDEEHLRDILSCRETNGFGTRDPAVAESLLYTTGSFYAAAKYALENNTIALSPTSGFHHAGHDFAGGFCTLNGLMVAAAKLLQSKPTLTIGIVDLDQHYGDGTEDILQKMPSLAARIHHFTVGQFEKLRGNLGLNEVAFQVARMTNEAGVDIVFYQAGADSHIDDPLGGRWTSEEMRERDRIVFELCRRANVPVVWNLAGGYQEDFQNVLDIHTQTLQEACAALSIKPDSEARCA